MAAPPRGSLWWFGLGYLYSCLCLYMWSQVFDINQLRVISSFQKEEELRPQSPASMKKEEEAQVRFLRWICSLKYHQASFSTNGSQSKWILHFWMHEEFALMKALDVFLLLFFILKDAGVHLHIVCLFLTNAFAHNCYVCPTFAVTLLCLDYWSNHNSIL